MEQRYLFGESGAQRFTTACSRSRGIGNLRLALWRIYVGAAAQRFVGTWVLEPEREAQMRRVVLASIREAEAVVNWQNS